MPDHSLLRVAFSGVSHPHAAAWADAIRDRRDASIVAVHDPDEATAEAFGRIYDCPVVPESAFVPLSIDAVVVDGRNDQSKDLALRALHAGMPVFLEKTGGLNSAELQEVADLARTKHLVTQMGYFLRYSDAVVLARDAIASGSLGRLTLARLHCAIPDTAWTSMASWFGDRSNVTGGLIEAGCHMVDIARYLLGEPLAVSAQSAGRSSLTDSLEDSVSAGLQFDGFTASLDFTAHEANPWNENWTIELYGTAATLRVGLTPSWADRNNGSFKWEHLLAPCPDTERGLAERAREENRLFMARGVDAFIQALHGSEPAPVDAESGASTLRLIERIYESAPSIDK